MSCDPPDLPKLYGELAPLWPLISPPADHAAEAGALRRALEKHLPARSGARRPTILELGAGGGHALSHLTDAYDAVAVDVSEPMLAHCRRLNPDVTTHVADMRTVRLGRTFDAVIAHDAIEYMTDTDDLRAACTTAAAHLDAGGVFLATPTYIEETFREYDRSHDAHHDDDTEVALVSFVHRPQPRGTIYELATTLIIRRAGQLRIEEDRHCCGLFPRANWIDALESAGFEFRNTAAADESGAAVLFAGVKRITTR